MTRKLKPIGIRIKEEMQKQGISTMQMAKMINRSQSDVYHIFTRHSLDCDLLALVSVALKRNYLIELGVVTERKIMKSINPEFDLPDIS